MLEQPDAEQSHDSDRHIDVEYGLPAKTVGQITAQSRAE